MTSGKFVDVYKLLEDFNFGGNENIPDKLRCLKCTKILINAYIGSCECQLCRICVDGLMEGGGSQICPGNTDECKESKLTNFQIDYRANREISKLVVKCPQDICSFKTELINMNEHLRVCPQKNVKYVFNGFECDHSNVVSANMNEHLQLENYSQMNILMGVIDNMRNEIDQLKENNERNKNEIDRLKGNDERNKNEIDKLKEIDQLSRKAIKKWKETDEMNKKTIEIWKETCETNKKAIEKWKETNDMNKTVIEIWKKTDEINKNAIEILKESDEINKKAIEKWKETDEINKNTIEKWKETDEVNKNAIEKWKDTSRMNKKVIDIWKRTDEINKNAIEILQENNKTNKKASEKWQETNEMNKNAIEIWKKADETNKNIINRVNESDERNKNETDMLKCNSRITAERIKLLEEEIKLLKTQKIDNVERKIERTISKARKDTDSLDAYEEDTNWKYGTDMETRMSTVEKRMHQQISGNFLWAIDKFQRRRKNSEVFESGYFYAKKQPYKMSLIMIANGFNEVTGTGISFILLVHPDSSFPGVHWPFDADVTVTVSSNASPEICQKIRKHLKFPKMSKHIFEALGTAEVDMGDHEVYDCGNCIRCGRRGTNDCDDGGDSSDDGGDSSDDGDDSDDSDDFKDSEGKSICGEFNDDFTFNFLFSDLSKGSLLIDDCFVVECRVDVRYA